jgi:hypothetical protein
MADDVLPSWNVAPARPPLLVLEPLEAFLDSVGIGSGPIRAFPIGQGHSNMPTP